MDVFVFQGIKRDDSGMQLHNLFLLLALPSQQKPTRENQEKLLVRRII